MRENWKYQPLGEIVEIKRGLTYSKNDEVDISGKIVLRSNNVNLDNHKFDFTELKYLKPTFDIPADKYLQKGDLLMCMSNGSKAHLGKVALYDGESDKYAFGGFMAALSHKDSVIGRYLFYAMITPMYKEYIKTLSDGANINNLKVRDIEAFSIPVPPLSEQERIVALLDDQFAKIDALKANAASQLQAAKDLFQSALKEMLTPKEGWERKTLEEISTDMYRGSGITRDQITEDGISCVRYGEIYTTYNYWFDNCKSHTIESKIKSPKYFEKGDILFTITGESVEDIAKSVAYLGSEKCLAGGDIVVMKHNQNAKYLSYALSTPDAIKQKGLGKTKLKVVHSNVPSIKSIVVPLPSLPEQERIAARLDAISEKVKALQANYDQTLTLCNDLKQSLLKSIFA